MVHRSESESNFDEILFKDRNKSYGAFEIRSVYNSHLRTSILLCSFFFAALLLAPKIKSLITPEPVEEKVEYKITEVILAEPPPIDPKTTPPPPPPPPPKMQAPKPPTIASTKFLPPKVVEDKKVVVEEKIATQEEMKESNPGEATVEGEKENLNEVISTGNGNGNAEVEDSNEILVYVGEPAEFVGDYGKFLRKNLRYPSNALEKQIQGKVHVKFVVERDGTINDIKVVKRLGHGCDEEAIRVIKLTNGQWTPGKDNGKPARSYKSLAIDFRFQMRD